MSARSKLLYAKPSAPATTDGKKAVKVSSGSMEAPMESIPRGEIHQDGARVPNEKF
jgi:hypothetical protein